MKNCVIETWDPNEGPAFPKEFTFDSVYDQDSNTETIYNDICYPLVEVYNVSLLKIQVFWSFECSIGNLMRVFRIKLPPVGKLVRRCAFVQNLCKTTAILTYFFNVLH